MSEARKQAGLAVAYPGLRFAEVSGRGCATSLRVLLLVLAEHGDDLDLTRGEGLDPAVPLPAVRVGPWVRGHCREEAERDFECLQRGF